MSGKMHQLKLDNVTWRVGVSPWVGLRTECLKNVTCEPGMELEFLTAIAKLLNVKLEFVESPTVGCGSQNALGQWSGLMELLQKGDIDITGNLCSLNEWRLNTNFSQYSFPISQDKQHFLLKVPESKYGFPVGGPFQLALWYILIASWLIFLLINTFSTKFFLKIPMRKALETTLNQMVSLMVGMEKMNRGREEPLKLLWFNWMAFVGYFLMLYNMYITGVLLKPLNIEQPFSDNEELAQAIFKGTYKLVDYHKPVYYPYCQNNSTCTLFRRGLEKHGYKHVNIGGSEQEMANFLNIMLNSSENLVLAQSKQYVDFYLTNFKQKSEFWLYEDEKINEIWYTYFTRADFKQKRDLFQAIIIVGDYKRNLFERYHKSTMFVHHEKSIRTKPVSSQIKVVLPVLAQPLGFYFGGVAGSVCILFIEMFKHEKLHSKLKKALQVKGILSWHIRA